MAEEKNKLSGRKVKVFYEFPLDNEIFTVTKEMSHTVEITGDFSAGTHNVCQSDYIDKNLIKQIIPNSFLGRIALWMCNNLGWHDKVKPTKFDGTSMHGHCLRCGNSTLKQDGQGNWF